MASQIILPTSNPTATIPHLRTEPDLIRRFLDVIEQAGLVGEKATAAVVFLSALSAKLQKPVNVTVQGSSSAGKNYLISRVASFIPEEMKKILTGMSPKVLMHAAQDEFLHKAIFIAEYEGVAKADYAIRTFQSEQMIEWEFVEASKDGIRKKSRKVKGPAAFIQATTRPVLHPENETRLLFVQMDESAELTRAILHRQAEESTLGRLVAAEELFERWHELIRSLELTSVVIPFAPKLVPFFPDSRVRSRRDFPKLLGLIEASAFLHQHQRAKQGSFVIADPKDYSTAKWLFEHSYASGPDKAVSELLATAEGLHQEKGEFSVADLMEKIGWGKSKTYEVLRRAQELACVVDGDKPGQYRFLRNSPPPPLALPEQV